MIGASELARLECRQATDVAGRVELILARLERDLRAHGLLAVERACDDMRSMVWDYERRAEDATTRERAAADVVLVMGETEGR